MSVSKYFKYYIEKKLIICNFLKQSNPGEAYFVHLSCNSSYVWAVDAEGGVYQRIGSGPPSPVNLNPVWLPIGTFGELLFTKIFVSPLDWMVSCVHISD